MTAERISNLATGFEVGLIMYMVVRDHFRMRRDMKKMKAGTWTGLTPAEIRRNKIVAVSMCILFLAHAGLATYIGDNSGALWRLAVSAAWTLNVKLAFKVSKGRSDE